MTEPSTSQNPWPGILAKFFIGLAIAMGGTYMAVNHVPAGLYEATKSLEGQGIPLDVGKTIGVIGIFIALFPLIKFFYVTPLVTAIDERNAELENTFSEAENLRARMEQIKGEYEQRIAATEASAREQIQAQIREAQQMRSQLMAEASAKAEDFLKKAREEIDIEKERAINDVRVRVVDMALMATEKVLGDNIDEQKNRKLIEEFIAKVEVPR